MSFVNEWDGTRTPSNQTVPAPVNPPHLMRRVQVKVLRPFPVAGKPLAIGDEVEIEYHLARDLAAIGKCVFVKEQEP